MDWNAKWDWENLVMFNSLTVESPKKQPTDWGIDEEVEIDTGSFNLSGGGGGGSGSDLAHGSSARSSISASTDSSSKEVINTSRVAFQAFHAFPGAVSKKNELARSELAGTSSPLESSDISGEPLIGLKLGKRTYFENNCTGGNARTSSFSVIPAASSAASVAKKTKSSGQSTTHHRCLVEGCNLDLSSAKDYHRKHRVCESHSKCPKVVVNGQERRFCQQCSRFHGLSEFDEKKRSCRRRLSDHNARRRKPQQDVIQFNSTRLSSPFLNGRQQMNFVLNNAPLVQARSSSNPTWESTCSSKFALLKGYALKSEKTGGFDGQLQLPGIELSHASSLPGQNSHRNLPSNGLKAEVFTQGLKDSMLSFNLDAAPAHCALSLLSTDSWGSEPTTIAFDHPFQVNLTSMPPPVMHGVPQGLPLSSSEFWHADRSTDPRRQHAFTANVGSHFQEIQPLKAAYESSIYSNLFG